MFLDTPHSNVRSSSLMVIVDMLGLSSIFEGGVLYTNGSNLSSIAKFSLNSAISSSLMVIGNDSLRVALSKLRRTSANSALSRW